MIRDKIKNRDIQNIDDDIIRAKRLIRERLCNDEDIIELLHNVELEQNEAPPDEYFGKNIFACIRVPSVEDKVRNHICFTVDDIEDSYTNEAIKLQYIQFVVFCNKEDIKTPYGIERHDAIGFCIRELFNWSDLLGMQMKLVYNREGVTDTNYYTRTMKFECRKPNSLQRGVRHNRYEFDTYRPS